MYEYAISFTLASDDTYAARYQSLYNEIHKSPGLLPWTETTSFALIKSPEKIGVLADRLYRNSLLIDTKDTLLVIDHISSFCIARGPTPYQNTLESHFIGFEKR